jgi:PAS domain-containing protein
VVDRQGRFVAANRALGELFEAGAGTLIGRGLIGCLNPDDREAIAAKLADAAAGHEDRSPVEIRLAAPGERTMVMLLSRFDQAAEANATFAGGATEGGATEGGSTRGAPAAIIPGSDPAGDPNEGLTLYFIDVTEQKHL